MISEVTQNTVYTKRFIYLFVCLFVFVNIPVIYMMNKMTDWAFNKKLILLT